jgi:CheY-like chemotaxis protein
VSRGRACGWVADTAKSTTRSTQLTGTRRLVILCPVPTAHWIMVVEDDHDIRETLVEILEDRGYECVEAEDGIQAIDILRQRSWPCVMLLDLMMPRMSGYEVVDRLRHEIAAGQLRVIVLTAGEPKTELLAGAEIVAKPPDLRQLLAAVSANCS